MPWQEGKKPFKGKQLHVQLEEADVNHIVDSCSLSRLLEKEIWNSECFHVGDVLTAYDRVPNVMGCLSDMTDVTLAKFKHVKWISVETVDIKILSNHNIKGFWNLS